MSLPSHPDDPEFMDPLVDLHRFYDGPLPRQARLAGRVGGHAVLFSQWTAARDQMALTRFAAARLALARRRRQLTAEEVNTDAWLCRLATEIPAARAAAMAVLA